MNYLIAYFISVPVSYYVIRWVAIKMEKISNNDIEVWGWHEVRICFFMSLFSVASVFTISFVALSDLIKLKMKFPAKPPKWL